MSKTKKPARSVESLKTLLAQINDLAPKRSKVSDGWIGDAKHASRHSDHNPEPDGTVDARDFTNDPNGGMDAQKLADAIVASKDPRLSYIICNGRIVSGRKGPKPWVWRKYSGANGHYHHMHVSVLDEGQDDKTPWKIESAFKKQAPKPGEDLTKQQVNSVMHLGSKGEFVEELQRNLNTLGYGDLKVDGDFGASTEAAVKRFQSSNGLEVDGWAGPRTIKAIGRKIAERKLQPKVQEAEAKVAAAEVVVDDAANKGKVSTTEWLGGIVGAGGLASTTKQIVDSVNETSQSVGSLITTLGPWVLLGVVVAGGAGYIIYDRRQKRLQASAVKKVM